MQIPGESTDGMAPYRSRSTVLAGRITEIVPGGCYVENADGGSLLRTWPSYNIINEYTPTVGDYWVIHRGGEYQSIAPRAAFEEDWSLAMGDRR